MKTFVLLILTFSTVGCATLGNSPETQGNLDPAADEASIVEPTPASPFQDQNLGPQIIIPATGGAPVIGIPLGGNIFEPVTGGAPVIGIPTSP
jgi:hypothetical protein